MDQELKTTFIPKKQIVTEERPRSSSRPTGFLTIISLVIFLVTLVLGGGAFVYDEYLEKHNKDLRETISKEEKNFEVETITDLQVLDRRLSVANSILDNHRALSPFFHLLEDTTLPTVRFMKFDFTIKDEVPRMSLSGEATGYQAIAQQSQVFGQHPAIRDHIFSNFILTPRGRVSFDLVFNVDPSLLNFERQVIEGGVAQARFLPRGDVVDPASVVEEPVGDAGAGQGALSQPQSF